MSTDSMTSSGILVGVDGSEFSDAAVRWAAREAGLRREAVTLMTVLERKQPYIVTYDADAMLESRQSQHDEGDRILAAARQIVEDAAGDLGLHRVQTQFLFAHPLWSLINASWDARMVVVGCRGRSALERLTLGSISSGLAHHSHCPVAVVHPDVAEPDPHAPILLGIDGSPASESATAIAFDAASRRRAPLIAMHAWENSFSPDGPHSRAAHQASGAEVLSERLAGWQETYPDVQVTPVVVHQDPGRWLVDHSDTGQLIVVGSHGRGGFAGMLLGSVSSTVVQAAAIPVIVARQD